jgi:hypothetical protein
MREGAPFGVPYHEELPPWCTKELAEFGVPGRLLGNDDRRARGGDTAFVGGPSSGFVRFLSD